jgi:CRP/FNR family transcriptional regulator/CRP/FNR family cyclic AMP-dependent transcriptional regulator
MNVKEVEAFAQHVPLFQDLSSQDIQAICATMIQRRFSAHQTILLEEDPDNQTFFIIVSGKVHVVVLTAEGKKTILATLQKGDFFGEMALLDGEPRSASVVAAQDCELLMLYRNGFVSTLKKYPQLTIRILIALCKRLRKSNRQINTLSLMSVYGRVADVLLQLAREQGLRNGDMIVIPNRPTHQVLAEMAGTSRETVTRILSQLQKKHYITFDRKRLVILDEKKLYD